jgi:hypothetical protein
MAALPGWGAGRRPPAWPVRLKQWSARSPFQILGQVQRHRISGSQLILKRIVELFSDLRPIGNGCSIQRTATPQT